jgi:polar amino acid transport system permease protein
MDYIFDVLLRLLSGVKITVIIFLITFILSIPLGLLGAMLRNLKIKPLNKIIDVYTWVIRGTPLLLQLYFMVYGIRIIVRMLTGTNLTLDDMSIALITFVINYTAYFIEIFRGGMNSINKGQFESAYILGLSNYQTYLKIIIPQTIKKTLPTITNEAINLVKDTSLVSAVAILDLLNTTKRIVSLDFRFDAYFIAAIFYLLLSYIIVYLFRKVEKKYAFYN